MSYSYKPLWKLLIDRGLTKTELAKLTGISKATIARMTRNEPVNLAIIDKICNLLQCNLTDVIEQIKD